MAKLVSAHFLAQEKDDKERAAREAELKRQEKEVEEFQQKMTGRRKRNRRQKVEAETPSFLQRYGKFIVAPMLVLLMAVFVYYLINTWLAEKNTTVSHTSALSYEIDQIDRKYFEKIVLCADLHILEATK